MRSLHNSSSKTIYKENINSFTDKYLNNHYDMYEYIRDQWLEGDFRMWQIFRNKPGYANTNSNLESFNATIKRDFTNNTAFYISGAIEHIGEIIEFYSENAVEFELAPKFDKSVLTSANKLSKANFKPKSSTKIEYKGKNNFFILRLNVDTCYNECSCTCSLFSKNAVCMHLIAFSNLFGKGLFGEQWYNVPTQFNHAPKRGRKTKKTCYGTISKRR